MTTLKLTKFAAVAALSVGLVAASAAPSRAGDLDPLFGGLIGGGIGSGIGYAAGHGKGAAIGGILGLGLGALIAASLDDDRHHPRHVAYAPPPPVYAPPVYTPPPVYRAPYEPSYQTAPYDPYAPAQYSSAYCRQYSGNLNIGGVRQPSYGTACMQPDGTWRIVN